MSLIGFLYVIFSWLDFFILFCCYFWILLLESLLTIIEFYGHLLWKTRVLIMFLLAPRETTTTRIAPGLYQTQTIQKKWVQSKESSREWGGGENLVVNNPLANFGKIWPEQQKRSSSAGERVLTENLRGLKNWSYSSANWQKRGENIKNIL